ncbi:tyrosine-type recombinase/integrase [Nocardia sp. bgisy118]|uniref:tyrosine-type recombinase/integrase n=1 Tax=Nocardia sp. bgisy118 TaxID=3413786 RepID=UPI003F49FED9
MSSGLGAVASSHPFYEHPITPAHHRVLFDHALGILTVRLPESLARLNPVTRYTSVLEAWFDWLDQFPGDTYQARWVASGADTDGRGWLDSITANHHQRNRFSRAHEAIVCCGAIRPSYAFLLTVRSKRLWSTWRQEHDTAMFTRIAQVADGLGRDPSKTGATLIDFCRMSIRTGKPLAELTVDDLLDYRIAVIDIKGTNNSISYATAYHCGRAIGLFGDGPAEFEALLTMKQRSPAEIVAQYEIASDSMRWLLTEYLTDRRPSMDYTSFYQLAHRLCRLFWGDIEAHHPGIDTHRLSRTQIEAWKQRLMTLADGSPRKRPGEVLLAVRCFYLDINHWANDEPQRWAQWAAPSPVTRQDARVLPRERRSETARIHARIRELSPLLPTLVRSVRQHYDTAVQCLQLARTTAPGKQFAINGRIYIRPRTSYGSSSRPRLQTDDGSIMHPESVEHDAFWSWAMIEVLRHTGIRIEELLELTHHSIQPYRQPNGTIVPLLQIAPSKTDTERVIPAGPELTSVLAKIIARVAGDDGAIAVVSRHDEHERAWSEPMPYLFQYRLAGRPRTFNSGTLRDYLGRAVERAGLAAQITPHDFRRLFTTDAVNNGLPVHIAAQLLGHQDLNTTMSYTAIYPHEVFTRYQQFIQRRRAERPTEEYRAPTAPELADFAAHFGRRRIELGSCVRPYGTPCVHEHACLRCPFQQIEPTQLPRLDEIQADITKRIDTARTQQWLGDIDQLQTTLTHIEAKRDNLLALISQPGPGLLVPTTEP